MREPGPRSITPVEKARRALRTRPNRLFTPLELCAAMNIGPANARKVARNVLRAGHSVQLALGLYWFTDGEPFTPPCDTESILRIACAHFASADIYCFSYDTALALRLGEPLPRVLRYRTNDRARAPEKVFDYELRPIVDTWFWSHSRLTLGTLEVAVDSAAEATLALLGRPQVAGVMESVRAVRRAAHLVDLDRIVKTAVSMKWQAAMRRIGYVLEACGYRGEPLERLHGALTKHYARLDPTKRTRGTWSTDPRWRLRLNVDAAALAEALAPPATPAPPAASSPAAPASGS